MVVLVACKECGCTGVAHINLQNYKTMFDAVMEENAQLKALIRKLEKDANRVR